MRSIGPATDALRLHRHPCRSRRLHARADWQLDERRGAGGGGNSATGGATGSGGRAASGGVTGSGGSPATGGTIGSGGSTATAGTTGSGGAGGSGGGGGRAAAASTGAGGSAGGSGGSATGGGIGSGGAAATGGSAGTGGSGITNACTGTASGTPANTLAVNVNGAQNVISSGIFGLLMERLGKNWQGGTFVGTSSSIPNTDGMRNDIIQGFKDAGVGMIEWPGGCAANSYNWSANKSPSNDIGTDRYMELCSLVGIPPIIAGPGTSTGAANNLPWLTYINNNTSHTDWALKYFKVGNEVWGCGGNQDEATYETNYSANFNMLSAPVNGKKLNVVASTGLIGNRTWFDAELMNQASMIDGIEIHDYIYHPSDIPNRLHRRPVLQRRQRREPGPDRAAADPHPADPEPVRSQQAHQDLGGRVGRLAGAVQFGGGRLAAAEDADGRDLGRRAAAPLHAARRSRTMAGMAQAVNVIHSLFLTREHRQRAGQDPGLLRVQDVPSAPQLEREVGAEHAHQRKHHRQQPDLSRCCRRARPSTVRDTSTSAWRTSTWSTPARSRSP